MKHLMRQTAYIKNPSGTRSFSGKPALGSTTTVKCRIERVSEIMVTATKDNIPIHARATFPSSTTIQDEAQVTYDSQEYRVKSVEPIIGGNGSVHHYEVKLQLWNFGT